ncbi:OPA3-domain-containing protein [Clavulina sp. PMI_390]|nr:OPA3-domain-containing protein [Clavulina sp. PMI_390]
MATVKLATLAIRTLAKPIAARLKQQAQQHDTFKQICISLAQWSHRSEVRLRTGLLGENPKNIRPLSEARCVEDVSSVAEGFLFAVAAALILGETWRGARKDANRRDAVDDALTELREKVETATNQVNAISRSIEERLEAEDERHRELTRILSRVVEIGLRGGQQTNIIITR